MLVRGRLEILAAPGRRTEIRADFPVHHQAVVPQKTLTVSNVAIGQAVTLSNAP